MYTNYFFRKGKENMNYNTMFSTTAILDGVTSGISCYIKSTKQWLKRNDGKSTLFPNFTVLNAKLFKQADIDYHDVEFYFMIEDKVSCRQQIAMHEVVHIDDEWRASRYEDIFGVKYLHIYHMVETQNYAVANIGYIDCRMNGVHDPNKDPIFEYSKLKTLRNQVKDTLEELAKYPTYGISIRKNKFGIDASIDNTTAHINIWTNSKLMDYNTNIKKSREDAGGIIECRCLPFLKDKDKYGTLYMFTSMDESDIQDTATRTKIDSLQESFILYLQDLYPDEKFSYVPCPFVGRIILSKEEDVYGNNSKNG